MIKSADGDYGCIGPNVRNISQLVSSLVFLWPQGHAPVPAEHTKDHIPKSSLPHRERGKDARRVAGDTVSSSG